jgi:hypothetical protein
VCFGRWVFVGSLPWQSCRCLCCAFFVRRFEYTWSNVCCDVVNTIYVSSGSTTPQYQRRLAGMVHLSQLTMSGALFCCLIARLAGSMKRVVRTMSSRLISSTTCGRNITTALKWRPHLLINKQSSRSGYLPFLSDLFIARQARAQFEWTQQRDNNSSLPYISYASAVLLLVSGVLACAALVAFDWFWLLIEIFLRWFLYNTIT